MEVRGKTGDGGIDGVGVLRVNLVSFQIYFQCKRWKGNVGSKEIRDFRGALQGRADKGLFITTGNFTSQASEEATRDGAIAIDLIDGDRLCVLLKQYELGVETRMIEKVMLSHRVMLGLLLSTLRPPCPRLLARLNKCRHNSLRLRLMDSGRMIWHVMVKMLRLKPELFSSKVFRF